MEEPKGIRLDAATAAAVAQEIADAKERGWLQADLRRYFQRSNITFDIYKAAIACEVIPEELHASFVRISISGLPEQPHVANPEAVRQHIEWLIEPARGRFDDALIEIAYDGPGRGPTAAKLFDFDQLDEAVSFVVTQNAKRSNIYVGAALRLPDTPRDHRASSEDFYVATAVPMDIDRDYDVTRARMAGVCEDGLVVTTGLTPERRSQHWARLIEPCDNDIEFGTAFASLVNHTGADMAVKDAARIMRMGGTVSFPNARKVSLGYCTELAGVTINEGAQRVALETLKALSPGETATGPGGDYSSRPQGTGIEYGGNFGTLVVNGREEFFRKVLLQEITKYQAENGADPDQDELFTAAFARFVKEADNSDGRWTSDHGQSELRKRAANTIRRLRVGRIAKAGLYSIDTEVGREEAERVTANRAAVEPQVTWRRVTDPETGEVKTVGEVVGQKLIKATPYQWIDAARIPPRDILYGQHYIRKFLCATVSPGGLGKSSLVMVEALAMVTGRTLLGDEPKRPLTVWYWNGEDPMEELQRRVAAACLHYGISEADLGGRLFMDSGRTTEIVVAREDGGKLIIAEPVVDALVQQVLERGIDALIIDPFVACHSVSENDNTKIEAVVKQWMRVADEGGCSVELVHHVRKPSAGVTETTVDDARGAGALLAKARSARVLNAMSLTEAMEIGIEPKERFSFFRVDNGKANLMPRGGNARWRRMVGVPLGNRIDAQEDNVGVATEWAKPDALAGITGNHAMAVQAAISQGEWRQDPQCSNWAGVAVAGALGLDLEDKSARQKVKTLITYWVKSGALELVEKPNSERKMKWHVIVGRGQ